MSAEAAPIPEENSPDTGAASSVPPADAGPDTGPDTGDPSAAGPTALPDPAPETAEPGDGEGPAAPAALEKGSGKIVPYDFRHPSLLAPSEVRKLSVRYEEFARSLATRLSIHLRLDFGVAIGSMETLPLRTFIEKQRTPTHYTLFRLDPLEGTGLLEMSPTLGLTMVDRLMGGPGHPVTPHRDLTEIEKALLDQTVQIVLKEWSQHVCREVETRLVLVGHENNGRFLQIASNDTNMVVLRLDITMGELAEPMHLALPYDMIEPLIRHFGPLVKSRTASTPARKRKAPEWNPALGSLQIPVVAQWTDLKVSAQKLTELKVGDILPIDPRHTNQVKVRFATVTKFIGRLGKCGHQWAVEVTGPVKK